jgi:hypothetical protein
VAYDEVSTEPAAARGEHTRYAVDLLRSWVGQKFRHHLPPAREDQEVALRELLELMVRKCPADLELLRVLEMEAMCDLAMTDAELATSAFYVRQIELAFAAADASADAPGQA